MPSLFEQCNSLFGTDDLYAALNINKDCTSREVKCAYHKLSLQVHPDRVEEKDKDEATKKFQVLGKIYSILSDKEKRAVYDETGEVDEENDLPQDRDWYDYWRLLFVKISVNDIKQYEQQYKGSEEELQDLKAAYTEFEGDMDHILENVLCTTVEDEPRFRKILDPLIEMKELPSFKSYTHEKDSKKKRRKRKADKEAKEAESMKTELGLGETDASLQQLIKQRQQSREQQMDGFFDQLAAKYASGGGKKKGKKGK